MDEKLLYRIWEAGFEVSFNPPEADGNCFYRAAAFQVEIAWDTKSVRRKSFREFFISVCI